MAETAHTSTIRPIETRYRGYRFRSRLEARWAVFFDALQLRWEYEPEGFDLGALGAYLPDFYLPDLGGGTWVEVKPEPVDDDMPKWRAVALHSKKDFLIAIGGSPGAAIYRCLKPIIDVHGRPDLLDWDVCFTAKYLPPRNHDGHPRLFVFPGGDEDADCEDAINAARSARFEHGEEGPGEPPSAPMSPIRLAMQQGRKIPVRRSMS